MAKTAFTTHDEYLATLPPASQAVLRKVRATIAKAVPEAEETISYQLPAYKVGGRAVLYYAAFTSHWSLSSPPSGLHKAFARQLAPYKVSKSAIQFPLGEPVPTKLVASLARYRADEALAAARPKDAQGGLARKP